MKREDLFSRTPADSQDLDVFVKKLGGDPDAIYAEIRSLNPRADISPKSGTLHFADWAQSCQYYEIAAKQLNAPAFGIRWAFDMPADYRTSGPTIMLTQIASNMRHFLDMAIDYQTIHTNGVRFSYVDNKQIGELTGTIAINPLSPPCQQFCEHVMAGIAVMGHRHIPKFKLLRATFQHSKPKDTHWHDKAFQCPLEFNADENTIVADRSVLGMERRSLSMIIAKPLLKSYLNWQLNRNPRPKQTMTETVATTLPKLLGIQNSDILFVATALDMHPKKLQRLLADEDTSYSEVLDDVRRNLAARLLIESEISIGRLAAMLDYSTDRSFTTAAKRWFDMTPTAYRKAAQEAKGRI